MSERPRLIALEGGDGSGKGTQSEILRKYVENKLGKSVLKISFPRYGKDSAYYATEYLNGAYGEADDVPPELASLAFIVDRAATIADIKAHLALPDGFVIADRYVASNLAHQGTKITDPAKRQAFYERTMRTEYDVLGIPKPDVNIVLLTPTNLAQANVDKKAAREYTDKKRDIHEASESHLDRAKANYEELCRLYPERFKAIQSVDPSNPDQMRPIDDVQQEIRELIQL